MPLILTDPPFGNAAEPLYRWLAPFAARVLIPGGSLICFTGQSTVLRDGQIFSEHLKYWWMAAELPTEAQRFQGRFVACEWKPVLWFVKQHRRGRTLVPDVLRPTKRDKALHAWSQGDGGVWPLIEHLTDPGEMILDPFCGTETFVRIGASMGRRCIGVDVVEGGATKVIAA